MEARIKTLLGIAFIFVAVIGVFFYMTRPAKGPSQDIGGLADIPSKDKNSVIYRISPEESKISFNVDEILYGKPFTPVGTTNQIAGDILVNMNKPENVKMGNIIVNARTFKTDSEKRDGAVARFILKSDDPANEFIKFTPKRLVVNFDEIQIGKDFEISIIGDIFIAGITKEVAVDGIAIVLPEGKIKANIEFLIKRSDFDLVIPQVPFVAQVAEKVFIKGDIVANEVIKE